MEVGFHLLRRAGYDEKFIAEVAQVMEYSKAYDSYRDDIEYDRPGQFEHNPVCHQSASGVSHNSKWMLRAVWRYGRSRRKPDVRVSRNRTPRLVLERSTRLSTCIVCTDHTLGGLSDRQ